MSLKQSFILAIKSLLGSKMRSFLTMLGIIIGIASVIALTSIFNGMTSEVISQMQSMGTTTININIIGRGGNRSVDPDELQQLAEENADSILGISPNLTMNVTIKNGNENQSTSCLGVNEIYGTLKDLKISSGRFLQYIDIERRQKNCVVGSYIVKNLFDGEDPVGKTIKVGGSTFTIIGVLEEKADSEEGSDDDKIIIPYTLARTFTRSAFISNYIMCAKDVDTVEAATAAVENLLLEKFTSTNFFRVTAMSSLIESMEEMTGMMSTVLAGIAGISLLVGGIGIMNIMLVSVAERTREIGIRKSLGAKRKDIMSQFIVEAATTSVIGGIIGIILGIVLSKVLAPLMDIKAVTTAGSVLLSFGISAAIGMSFGFFPANKAAKLNPIDALRHD